jgi:hypothetical protein
MRSSLLLLLIRGTHWCCISFGRPTARSSQQACKDKNLFAIPPARFMLNERLGIHQINRRNQPALLDRVMFGAHRTASRSLIGHLSTYVCNHPPATSVCHFAKPDRGRGAVRARYFLTTIQSIRKSWGGLLKTRYLPGPASGSMSIRSNPSFAGFQ